MIEIKMVCYDKEHKAYLDNDGVIHSNCYLCNGMLLGDVKDGKWKM